MEPITKNTKKKAKKASAGGGVSSRPSYYMPVAHCMCPTEFGNYSCLPLFTPIYSFFTLVYPLLPHSSHGNNSCLAHRKDDFLILFSFRISLRLLALNSLSFSLKVVTNEAFLLPLYEATEKAQQT
jgi:hypothetical protein